MNRQNLNRKSIVVSMAEVNKVKICGILHCDLVRGKEVFSFEYEKNWLENSKSISLDPALSLYRGPQYPDQKKPNFGIFLDSSPDRWGRVLMKRREALHAKEQNRAAKTLLESDYL